MFLKYGKDNKFEGFFPNFVKDSIKISEELYHELLGNNKEVVVDAEALAEHKIEELTKENADLVLQFKEIVLEGKKVTTQAELLMGQVAGLQLQTMKMQSVDKNLLSQVAQSQLVTMNTDSKVEKQENTVKVLLEQLAAVQISNMEMSKQLTEAKSVNKLLLNQQATLLLEVMELKKGGK